MPLADPAAKAAYQKKYIAALRAKDPEAFKKYHREHTAKWQAIPENRAKQAAYHKVYQAKTGQKSRYKRSPHGRYVEAVSQAKSRKRVFTLTEEEYYNKTSGPCFYCDQKLNPTGVGLDRIDNALGYTVENTVPSCRVCNILRKDQFTSIEFKLIGDALKKIYAMRGE